MPRTRMPGRRADRRHQRRWIEISFSAFSAASGVPICQADRHRVAQSAARRRSEFVVAGDSSCRTCPSTCPRTRRAVRAAPAAAASARRSGKTRLSGAPPAAVVAAPGVAVAPALPASVRQAVWGEKRSRGIVGAVRSDRAHRQRNTRLAGFEGPLPSE